MSSARGLPLVQDRLGRSPSSPKELLAYLIGQGLTPSDAVAGVVFTDRSSRQQTFHVRWPCGPSYIVKHATTREQSMTMRLEISAYRQLSTQRSFQALAPNVVHADPDAGILVLEAVDTSRSCDPLATGSQRTLMVIARALGRALATLHTLPRLDDAPRSPRPGALVLTQPPADLREQLGGAAAEVGRLVQRDPLLRDVVSEGLDTWRAAAWVHGEIKWPHCLIAAPNSPGRRRRLYLIDFENSGIGDPAWDLGCVIAAYLTSWLASMPPPASADAETLVARSAVSLPEIQRLVGAFWETYVAARRLPEQQHLPELAAATRHAVARLLWTIVETSVGGDSLGPRSLLALQLAHNLADRPRDALSSLLGLVPR